MIIQNFNKTVKKKRKKNCSPGNVICPLLWGKLLFSLFPALLWGKIAFCCLSPFFWEKAPFILIIKLRSSYSWEKEQKRHRHTLSKQKLFFRFIEPRTASDLQITATRASDKTTTRNL
jgi:hypothetical protein